MQLTVKTPIQSLEKVYRLQSISREQVDRFKVEYTSLFERINEKETEENIKGHLTEFLKTVYYSPAHLIATKDKTDFVIHTGKEASTPAGVLFEVKRPINKGEMVSQQNLNMKAMQELILYYFRERIQSKNSDIRHCVITNVYEWFIFDAADFERLFYRNNYLANEYHLWASGQKVSNSNNFFYKDIIKPFLDNSKEELPFTYVNLRDYKSNVKNTSKEDDKDLLTIYKILSPTHLLKLPASTDSNALNPKFYLELLHIIGLEEIKEGGKKVIQRKALDKRDAGSLLESTITALKSDEILNRFPDAFTYGKNLDEQLFTLALELCITWVNRILFLKLLESQLVRYHKNKSYSFLNAGRIGDFNVLYNLFFKVLALKTDDRDATQKQFDKIPYLNSSLFEISDLERDSIRINSLDHNVELPLYRQSVLKDNSAFKHSTEFSILRYLFAFLDAYDFASESREAITEKNRTLINASVLGLIFEKINGYKDGSFYTPGFITEYMCHETIRRAVLQKFNDVKGWNCADITALYNKITDATEANNIINDIRICDPAVGSGHFLVSALNELIAIKSELGVLIDETGKRIRDYTISIVNDELIVLDEDGNPFAYTVQSSGKVKDEVQRVQKTLFHEKQTLIENCLFGVDINPNSVKICRLRLWIELLKNAYYTNESDFAKLETLPNIDINIKQGNSLLSKFSLTEDLSDVFRKQSFSLRMYKDAVTAYKEAKSKEAKADLQRFINEIKSKFRETVYNRDPRRKKLAKLRGERTLLDSEISIFNNVKDPKLIEFEKKRYDKLIEQTETEISSIENNILYRNSFEWRFEFPEVLDDKGDFLGFDAIIGNPPYGVPIRGNLRDELLKKLGKVPDYEIYYLFINLAYRILHTNGIKSYIIPNTILFNVYAREYRLALLNKWQMNKILDCTDFDIFSDATVRNIITVFTKNTTANEISYKMTNSVNSFKELVSSQTQTLSYEELIVNNQNWGLVFKNSKKTLALTAKIKNTKHVLSEYFKDISQGLIAYDKYRNQSTELIKSRVFHSFLKINDNYKAWLWGEDVTRYMVSWNGKEYVNYSGGVANPREPKFFNGSRILIREITNPRIFAAITEAELYNDPAIIIVLPNAGGYPLTTLLALLNSKLVTFYHFNASPKATKGAFPKILVDDVKNLPIPEVSSTNHDIIKNLVDQILIAKYANVTTDTSALEAEIDQLIYALYGLTDEEIAIIDGRTEK